jgi:hypothetical protein
VDFYLISDCYAPIKLKQNKIIDDSLYNGPASGSQFEGYPLPFSRQGSSCCVPAFSRLPSRNALSVGAMLLYINASLCPCRETTVNRANLPSLI